MMHKVTRAKIKFFVEFVSYSILFAWATLFIIGVVRAWLGGYDGVFFDMNSRGEMLPEIIMLILVIIGGTTTFIYNLRDGTRRW